jgi:undecaprenyl phosphate N,N'-diacetylbacillosamine 1-phosphate transferase
VYRAFFKPFVDKLAALTGLIVGSPFMLISMLALVIANRGKVWFVQERPGMQGRPFKIIKFKTMTDERDANGHLLSDERRLTIAGKVIRRLSLDELPQLINVLLGQMSIVGPRPLLLEYVVLYNETQKKRMLVKPGITGWAQVNGRNTISWKQKFEYDVWYVDNLSFLLDVKIVFLTALKVLKAEGIASSTSATMEKFNGNE